jgi:hypothetical protein
MRQARDRPDRSLDDPHADSAKHRVEGCRELGIPVPDQELQPIRVIVEVHHQVAGLLGHPLPHGMRGDPGQVHAAGAVLDEEQHVQAAQQHRIDVEEVGGDDGLGLGLQERPPGLPQPGGGGVDAGALEDPPDR